MTYTRLEYGSKGDDVKTVQSTLNSKGYSLDVDGSYGPKTQAAVKDYQSKNNLSVDGVVGNQTWSSLLGSSSTEASSTANSSLNTGYTPSSTVQDAQAKMEQAEASKPVSYTSQYDAQIQQLLNEVVNPEAFSYNPNNDSTYLQYRDQYTQNGKLAMEDAIGQAAALSGGYGNSYAQSVGQQTYNQYMSELANKIPELEELAYSRYQNELASKQNALNALMDVENTDYSRYKDLLDQYYTELDYATNRYNTISTEDYNKYIDSRNYDYQLARNAIDDQRYADEWAYQKERDAVSDSQYAEELAYQQARDAVSDEQWNKLNELSTSSGSTGMTEQELLSAYNEAVETAAKYPDSKEAQAVVSYLASQLGFNQNTSVTGVDPDGTKVGPTFSSVIVMRAKQAYKEGGGKALLNYLDNEQGIMGGNVSEDDETVAYLIRLITGMTMSEFMKTYGDV